jgi:hypothetical protein
MTLDTSGPDSLTPLAYFDPGSRSWRTSQGTFHLDSTPSSLTLPRSGMTRDGSLYELPTSALPTVANGCSSLLPTPTVNDMGEGKTIEWWDEWQPRQKSADGRPAPHGKSLAIEALRLLPTPTNRDHKDHKIGPAKHRPADTDTLSQALAPLPISDPTRQPLSDGSKSSDEAHPIPPSTDDSTPPLSSG